VEDGICLTGRGVRISRADARKFFDFASIPGDPLGYLNRGLMDLFVRSRDVPDRAQVRQLYRNFEGIQPANPCALPYTGLLKEWLHDEPPPLRLPLDYREAAKTGSAAAQFDYARALGGGPMTVRYYCRAAQQNDPDAMAALNRLSSRATGTRCIPGRKETLVAIAARL
jgi:TPR repeat protein